MVRILGLLTLCIMLLGCTGKRFEYSMVPSLGMTTHQVEARLGQSLETLTYASGYEVWRYGVSRGFGDIHPDCDVRYTNRCMHVYFYQNRVIDVKRP